MAVAIAATIFAGFAPTYYLYPWLHGMTSRGVASGASLTPLVHVHAIIGSLWIILFITQAGFDPLANGMICIALSAQPVSFLPWPLSSSAIGQRSERPEQEAALQVGITRRFF